MRRRIEAADGTIESVDAAIEEIDLIVEDAIAQFEVGDQTACAQAIVHADELIETLASEAVVDGGDGVIGILAGSDLLVEAVVSVVSDADEKVEAAYDALGCPEDPPLPGGVLGRACRALLDADAAAEFAP